ACGLLLSLALPVGVSSHSARLDLSFPFVRAGRLSSHPGSHCTHNVERVPEGMLLTLGCRRLGHILHVTWFVVHLSSSMGSMFPLVLHLEFGDCHMLQPIAFLAFRAVHGGISSGRRVGPMKMVIACLPTIRLRFGTKP